MQDSLTIEMYSEEFQINVEGGSVIKVENFKVEKILAHFLACGNKAELLVGY